MNRKLVVFGFIILLASCDRKLSPAEYIDYIQSENGGFKRIAIKNDWLFKVQYKPASYIYLQENKNENLNNNDLKKRKTTLKNWKFFNVYVRHTREKYSPIRLLSQNQQDYNLILNYYLQENKNSFVLYTEADTVYPSVYVYENNYGLSPEDVFVVAFETYQEEFPTSMLLQYDDRYLTNSLIKFHFKKEELSNEPELNL